MREVLFDYMMGLVLSDRKIKDTEIEFLFMMGENVFGYTRKECADKLAVAIQSNFVPSFDSLC
jgi:hypothetical protein